MWKTGTGQKLLITKWNGWKSDVVWCLRWTFFFFTFLFPIWDELHKKYAIPLKYKHKHIYLKHCNKSTTYKNMSC